LPGHPDDSEVYYSLVLPLTDESHMPPTKLDKTPLTKEESETIRQWIAEGANWPDGVTLKVVMKVEFVRDIEPILEHGGPLPDKPGRLCAFGSRKARVGRRKSVFHRPNPQRPHRRAAGQIDFARDVEPIFAHGGALSDKPGKR
jgi:hypothetical protein